MYIGSFDLRLIVLALLIGYCSTYSLINDVNDSSLKASYTSIPSNETLYSLAAFSISSTFPTKTDLHICLSVHSLAVNKIFSSHASGNATFCILLFALIKILSKISIIFPPLLILQKI